MQCYRPTSENMQGTKYKLFHPPERLLLSHATIEILYIVFCKGGEGFTTHPRSHIIVKATLVRLVYCKGHTSNITAKVLPQTCNSILRKDVTSTINNTFKTGDIKMGNNNVNKMRQEMCAMPSS